MRTTSVINFQTDLINRMDPSRLFHIASSMLRKAFAIRNEAKLKINYPYLLLSPVSRRSSPVINFQSKSKHVSCPLRLTLVQNVVVLNPLPKVGSKRYGKNIVQLGLVPEARKCLSQH